jgi:uncharacterized protein YhfF
MKQEPGALARRWGEFLKSPEGVGAPEEPYLAERFGDGPGLADELAGLICEGRKTATCSSLWEWEHGGDAIPKVGDRSIVLDASDAAVCIIETTEVRVCAYEAVDGAFAYDEGEGGRSLETWRREHWAYFTRVLGKIGREPALEMPLVCERFRVVYQW